MLCVPEASVEVVYFAGPPLRFTVFSVVVPSLKVTEPLTPPPNCAVTLAVKVTDSFGLEGFNDETSVVVVMDWFTVCVRRAEALPVNSELPS